MTKHRNDLRFPGFRPQRFRRTPKCSPPDRDILGVSLPLILRALLRLAQGQSAAHLLSNLEAVLRELEREP